MAVGELHGLRALVTGASKGMGHAIATRLHAEGAILLGTARTAPLGFPRDAQFIPADLGSADGCAAVAQAVRDRLEGIDVVVHVVGGSTAPAGGFAALDDREWQRALDLNLIDGGTVPTV
jgi:NAD(P)-dependent dehydrogenase (short-subunit alcohol dehydrogenase family)